MAFTRPLRALVKPMAPTPRSVAAASAATRLDAAVGAAPRADGTSAAFAGGPRAVLPDARPVVIMACGHARGSTLYATGSNGCNTLTRRRQASVLAVAPGLVASVPDWPRSARNRPSGLPSMTSVSTSKDSVDRHFGACCAGASSAARRAAFSAMRAATSKEEEAPWGPSPGEAAGDEALEGVPGRGGDEPEERALSFCFPIWRMRSNINTLPRLWATTLMGPPKVGLRARKRATTSLRAHTSASAMRSPSEAT